MQELNLSEFYDEVNNKVAKVCKDTETGQYYVQFCQKVIFNNLQEAEDKAEEWVLK